MVEEGIGQEQQGVAVEHPGQRVELAGARADLPVRAERVRRAQPGACVRGEHPGRGPLDIFYGQQQRHPQHGISLTHGAQETQHAIHLRAPGSAGQESPAQGRDEAPGAFPGEDVVAPVAGEDLVATISLQHHLHTFMAQGVAEQIEGNVGSIGERLVVGPHKRAQHLAHVADTHEELAVVGTEALGEAPGPGPLVDVHALVEARGVGAQLARVVAGRERRDRSGVDPSREEERHGDIGHQVARHRRLEPLADSQHQVLEVRLVGRERMDVEEPALRPLAARDAEMGSGEQLVNALECGFRQKRVPVVEILVEEAPAQPRFDVAMSEQRLDLRGKQDPLALAREEQRLDPEAVAREMQDLGAPIPEREREHPVQAAEDLLAPLEVGAQDHFRVGPSAKDMTRASRAPRAALGSCRPRRCTPARVFRRRTASAGGPSARDR